MLVVCEHFGCWLERVVCGLEQANLAGCTLAQNQNSK